MNERYPSSSHAFIQAASDDVFAVPSQGSNTRRHFIVAVDFGTTFSSVSVYCRRGSSDVDSSQISSIANYPHAASYLSQSPTEVPTQSWYPKQGMPFRQPIDTETNISDEEETVVDAHTQNSDHIHATNGQDWMDVDQDEEDEDRYEEDDGIVDRYYWGYGVSKILVANDTHREQSRCIVRSKLLLDHSVHTKHIRAQLSTTVRDLRARKLIRDETDIIADFLKHLLRHTRSQMESQYDYHNDCSVEFVLCVPAMWTEKALRTMQNAITRALRESEFIENSNHDVDNLFIVTEPEAASTYVLDKSGEITPGDCFVLLDAGGGTVDAITYKVKSKYPLRLEREEFEPEGALCGSSYLNEEFEKLLWHRLASHRELEKDGITIQGKINELMYRFETQTKRGVDIYSDEFEPEYLPVTGLKPTDQEKYTRPNRLIITKNDFRRIFKHCLDGVSKLMFSQLEKAEDAGVVIGKVILIGGFASSPSLVRHLKKKLMEYSLQKRRRIPVIVAPFPGTAVAHGAVLRAANKMDGPERRIRSSFGILRAEPYEPTQWEAHANANPWHDPVDGRKYIKKTIDWVVNKFPFQGELLPSGTVITRPAFHTFPVEPDIKFICEEVLYISSRNHESHYRNTHFRNRGCERAGHILVDMTFLKDDPNFHPVDPGPDEKGRLHYRVEFELAIIIDGRNLRFEARYPGGEHSVVRGARQISIAASFQPGTE
ncbi:hypothetical protein UA08_00533 [Talaromyces atroroseus]|uniref:Uncharacterized protein n=1 Tax=Talaromyces atroroseus TaxID=1441469 RepID=A0A225ARG6_TALAT|nr:hypothetical protein UA08_00533 [Talaromyces atroroseus]OKL64182.1 hypothetical protein UA08_00533 [Talaromyces atroroseus]